MKIGITCSTFDLLHAGHVIMLEESKKHCDYLICALQVDPSMAKRTDGVKKNPPVQSLVERYLQLDAVKWVDKIIPYTTEQELEEIFMSLPINVRIIGEEYREKNYTAREICERRGIEIIYNKREHNYSSSDLRRRTAAAEQSKNI
jgi:glycerol-3-phosphate cytidylyltransferase